MLYMVVERFKDAPLYYRRFRDQEKDEKGSGNAAEI